MKEFQIAALEFGVSYLSCLLVPIFLCIELEYSINGALSIILIILDGPVVLSVLRAYRTGNHQRCGILSVSVAPSVVVMVWALAGGSEQRYLLWATAPRLLKCLLLPGQYHQAVRAFGERVGGVSATASRILLIGLFFIFYASTMACLWFSISCTFTDHVGANCLSGPTWIAADSYEGIMQFSSVASRYFRALHFVTQTLATIGYGDIHPVNLTELLFSLVLLLSGALFYGFVISCITSLLSSRDITTKLFRNDLGKLKHYLKLRKAEDNVKEKFAAYYEFLFARQLGVSEQSVLAALPDSIAQDIRISCCLNILQSVPFFQAHPHGPHFAQQCVARLIFATHGPGSVLCAAGSADRVLFLIRSGKVDLISPQAKKAVLSFSAGDYFGDYNMIFGKAVELDAVASGFTEVATLSYASLAEVLDGPAEGEEGSLRRADSLSAHSGAGGRARRSNSLVQFTREIQHFTVDGGASGEALNSAAMPTEESGSAGGGGGAPSALAPALSLTVVRQKPAFSGPSAGGSRSAAVAPILEDVKEEGDAVAPLVVRAPRRGSTAAPAAPALRLAPVPVRPAGPAGSRGKGTYRMSLCATYDSHQALLMRIDKTVQAMQATSKTKKLAAMMEVEEARTNTATIHPSHPFRCVWDCVLVVVILYYNLAVLLRIMARYHCDSPSDDASLPAHACLSRWDWSLPVDYLCDAAILAEFVLRARFFAFRRTEGEKTVIETDPAAIWAEFQRSSRFALMAWLILPVDVLAPATGFLLCLRLAKVSSIALLTGVIHDIQQWLDHERGVGISAEAVTVTHLTLYTAFVTIWMTVGWCILHFHGAQQNNWISALYWCLTSITTTGYGDITPADTRETVYNIGVSIVGPTIFATIIAKFASYVKKVDVSTDNMEHRSATAGQFVRTVFNPYLLAADNATDGDLAGARSPFELDDDGSVKTTSASCKTDMSAGGAFPRKLSSLSTSASNLLRNTVRKSAVKLQEVAHTLRGTGPGAKYRPAGALSTRAGMEGAVGEFFQYMDRGGKRLVERFALPAGHCDAHIQENMRLAVLEEAVAAVPIFGQCDKAFHREVVRALVQQLHPRRTTVVDKCVPEGLYLVKNGTLRVVDLACDRTAIRHGGQAFAEEALLNGRRSTALEVEAQADCELWFLSRTDFERILDAHPQKTQYLRQMRATLMGAQVALPRQQSASVSLSASMSKAGGAATPLRRGNVILQEQDLSAASKTFQDKRTFFVLAPDSAVAMTWMSVLSLFALYNFVMIPLRIAFFQGCDVTTAYVVDYLGDALYLADILLRLNFLGYYDRDDLVLARPKIRGNYLKSRRIYRDVLSVLPFDLLALVGSMGTLGPAQVLSVFRLNRLLRLLDANAGIVMLESSLSKLVASKSRGLKNMIRLAKLILTIFLIAHAFGCCFFLIANQLHLAGDTENWADSAGLFPETASALGEQPSAELIFTQYVSSIYWATALLTTVGYGDIAPVSDWERLYNVVLFVIGTLVYATVIVHLQDIVSELDVTSDLHKGRVHKLQSFLVREQVATDFIIKGRTYMEKLWSTQRGAQSAEIRAFLPPALYTATLNSCASRFLPQLFFVQKCHAAFQSAFLSNLKVTHYLKDEVLFRTAEAANRLYFICQGEVSLVSIDLQTETCTADAIPPLRHRQSFLGTLGKRRSSLQGSPFKNAADAASDKSAKSKPRFSFTSFAARGSIVLPTFVMGKRTSSASAATVKTAASGLGSTRKKGRRTSYLKVQDGFIGETEFFTRSCYSCSAKVNTDAIVLEIDFDNFRELVVRFGLQDLYKKSMRRDESQLQRNSTLSVVQKLDNNMANKKMAKMMSVCMTEAPQLRCWLPDSPRAQAWEALAFLLTALLAVNVPYFTAFPHSNVAMQLSIDALSTVVFAAGTYLRMHVLAVMHDGTLITEPSEISAHYITHHLRADVLATLPVGLLAYAASRSPVVYGALRWTSLLRLHRISGWIDQALTAASTAVGQPLSDGARRVLAAIVAVLYMAHLAGCLFCTIGRVEMEQGTDSWITANDFQAGQAVSTYLRSYYWALYTLTTVGYGSLTLPSNCERIFAMMVMVLGSILNAMLSALLNSLVESSDQSSGLIRRASEAAAKFCASNHVDAPTQAKVSAYYKYLADTLHHSPDAEGFGLLNDALRSELVFRTAWKALRRVAYLDRGSYDKAAQHGFILSLVRKMSVYLAVPGEVLASAALSALRRELLDTNTRSTGSEGTAAALRSRKSSRRRRQEKFYKDIDLMVLRRGVAWAALSGKPSEQDLKTYIPVGGVVNLISIAAQLSDSLLLSQRRRRSSAEADTDSTRSQQADRPTHDRSSAAVHGRHWRALELRVHLQQPHASGTALRCRIRGSGPDTTDHGTGARTALAKDLDLVPSGADGNYCASLTDQWITDNEHAGISLEIFRHEGEEENSSLLGVAQVSLSAQGKSKDAAGDASDVDTSSSSSTSSSDSDDLHTATDDAAAGNAAEIEGALQVQELGSSAEQSTTVSAPPVLGSEVAQGSAQRQDRASQQDAGSPRSSSGTSASSSNASTSSDDDQEEAEPACGRQGGSGKLATSAGSTRWRGHSSRNDAAGLHCISEESASTERSEGSSADLGNRRGNDSEQREFSADVLSFSGDVIGSATLAVREEHPHASAGDVDQQSAAKESLQVDAAEGQGASTEVCVRAETFCHLFRVSAAECRALKEYFRLTRQPVAQRMSWK